MKIVMGFEFIIYIIIPSERGDLQRDFSPATMTVEWNKGERNPADLTDILMVQAKFTSENIPRHGVISYDGY